MSTVKIAAGKKIAQTSDELYGIFFEDINRAGDGGLYPELLRNRTFEDSILPEGVSSRDNGYSFVTDSGWKDEFNNGEGLSRWVRENRTAPADIPAWYCAGASYGLDREHTLNGCREVSLRVSFNGGGYIYNTGFNGIYQKKGAVYRLTVFVSAGKDTFLTFSTEENGRVCGSCRIEAVSGGFEKYCVSYTAAEEASNAHFIISGESGMTVNIGFISLMPEETFMGHGLRTDLMEKLKELHPGFMRFPGGCVVEGITPSTVMKFKNTIGPVWERPGSLSMWHYRSYTGLGFHEYLQMCEDLGAEPVYVCNCGMTCQARNSVNLSDEAQDEIIQDTLDAIAYATEPADGRWGRRRAEAGHPGPFSIKYIEIGNENWGTDYEVRYEMCRKAIHERYPDIRFIANAHIEKSGYSIDYADEHYYETAESFAETADRFDGYDRKGPKIMLGEVSVVRGYIGQLYGALGEAALLTGIEKNQDVISFAAYAPLLENIHFNAWRPNMIRFDNKSSIGTPSYHVWKLFGQNRTQDVSEISVNAGVEYRPLKGMGSVIGDYGLRFRNAMWNGKPVEVSHELMGTVKPGNGCSVLSDPTKEQLDESKMLWGSDPEKAFVVFGSEDVSDGDFSVEIRVEKGKKFEIGLFSSRAPKGVYVPDETHPPRDFNPESVQPLRWKIADGKSVLYQPSSAGDMIMSPEAEADILEERFNQFRYSAHDHKVRLFINGLMICEVKLPSFPSLFATAGSSGDELVVKLVNMSEKADRVNIMTEYGIEDEYEAITVSGRRTDENSFDAPLRVSEKRRNMSGASEDFVYEAPPFSANVLRLKKK